MLAFVVLLAPSVYVLAGGPKLWGPERGVPFCEHPFELSGLPGGKRLSRWRCPKCQTVFLREENRWVPERLITGR